MNFCGLPFRSTDYYQHSEVVNTNANFNILSKQISKGW